MALPMSRSFLAFALLLLAGCATPQAMPPPPGPDRQRVTGAVSLAAAQVRRCYRAPKIPREGRQIVTTLRVRFATDGTLAGLPMLAAQASVTPANQIYAGVMADAAREAVLRCQPYRLPADLYQGGWDEFDLTFSPRAIA